MCQRSSGNIKNNVTADSLRENKGFGFTQKSLLTYSACIRFSRRLIKALKALEPPINAEHAKKAKNINELKILVYQ